MNPDSPCYNLHSIFILDSDIRLCVLGSLDERFDDHLAQAENLSALFVALNDEVFEIREIAICMIGRLSSKNPAYVMPSLRKTLIQVQSVFFCCLLITLQTVWNQPRPNILLGLIWI